jgi:hypothetical protein
LRELGFCCARRRKEQVAHLSYQFFIGCNKIFGPEEVVYEISRNDIRAVTARFALNCGDKFDIGNGAVLYLCEVCKRNFLTKGYKW